jgi:hypothetical protein
MERKSEEDQVIKNDIYIIGVWKLMGCKSLNNLSLVDVTVTDKENIGSG